MSKVLYPGSFDPLHNGHIDIITVASDLFGEVVVAAMHNPHKPAPLFDGPERVEMITDATAHLGNVTVVMFSSLVVQLVEELGIDMIVKGLRGVADFESELQMAQMNRSVSGVHTVFLPATSADAYIASKYIRDIARYGGEVSHLMPEPVARRLKERLS
jgi:pantetheine-phosphate adenylyltransferase